MKTILLLAAFLSGQAASGFAQAPGSIWALVVGISDYHDARIPDLSYADRDAEIFAAYLQSRAGGSVAPEHLRLLTNERATQAAINDALDWLMTTTQKGDRVILYFSGHGDVEKQTLWQLGYLLAYDTPFNNYRNNAIRLEDLNDLVATLSVGREARVIIITDACRSGKLAGSDNRGPSLTAEQVAKQAANEVRIMSCKPEQVSLESKAVGGGRGLFSYYLVDGLKGLAEQEADDRVTLYELEQFVKPKVRQEAQERGRGARQDPVFVGDADFRLAVVDEATLAALKQDLAPAAAQAAAMPDVVKNTFVEASEGQITPVQNPLDAFFNVVKKTGFIERIDFQKVVTGRKEEISPFFIREFSARQKEFGLSKEEETTLREFYKQEKQLKNDPAWRKQFEHRLAIALHDWGQEMINLYLDGDTTELSKREYYSNQQNYESFPVLFAVALRLLEPNHPLHPPLLVKEHYFTGLIARLKAQKIGNALALLEQAIEEQKKSLDLDDKAAYVHNELGLLYLELKEFAKAEQYFEKAIELAPTWALPWSNLCGLYAITNQLEKGKIAGEKAIALKPDYFGVYNNTGLIYLTQGDLLKAEESYRKSIDLNARHWLAYQQLGYTCISKAEYVLADSFFNESEKMKQGFSGNFSGSGSAAGTGSSDPHPDNQISESDAHWLDIIARDPKNVDAHFELGKYYIRQNCIEDARKMYKKVIELAPNHPLVLDSLGMLAYRQGNFEEAEIVLQEAILRHPDSIANQYILGNMYQKWQYSTEAERAYRQIIERYPKQKAAYRALWRFMERNNRYLEAESVLTGFAHVMPDEGANEINDFYQKMTRQFPSKPEWHQKLGISFYRQAMVFETRAFVKKTFDPDLNPDTLAIITLKLDAIREYAEQGIASLQKALELDPENSARADMLQKIGDLYFQIFLPDQAVLNYEKVIALQPTQASPRLKMAEACTWLYRYQAALTQLEYLYQNKQINYPNRLLLIKFYLHAGRYTEAQKLLAEAQDITPFKDPDIINLLGLLFLRSGQAEQAILCYREYIALRGNDAGVLYSIARAQAALTNKQETFTALDSALAAGFSFKKVLQNDPVWANYRDEQQWRDLMAKYFPEK